MKRTTVYLEESTDFKLKQLASQKGISKAELIRDALNERLARAFQAAKPLPAWVGMVNGKKALSVNEQNHLLEALITQDYEDTRRDFEAQE